MKNILRTTVWFIFYMILSVSCAKEIIMLPPSQNEGGQIDNDDKDGFTIPDGAVKGYYDVWVNGEQIKVDTALTEVADQARKENAGGDYYFAGFDIGEEEVEVVIRTNHSNVSNLRIRPNNRDVKFSRLSNSMIGLRINKSTKLSIEPNGRQSPLYLFADDVETDIPDKNDPNVIYFGPGIHKPNPRRIVLTDNQTLYLERGAVVQGAVNVKGKNTTIRGRGILDGDIFTWVTDAEWMITNTGNDHTRIKDLFIRGAASWTIRILQSKDIEIDNVKIMNGKWINDDGVDIVNSTDIKVTNCFIRSVDDAIAIKGLYLNSGNTENIEIKNCIFWVGVARAALLGHESRTPYMRNILFDNIDILHYRDLDNQWPPFVLEPGEGMVLQNVVFKNIRIDGDGQKELFRLKPTINQYMETQIPGVIRDIRFENIELSGVKGEYLIHLEGYSNQYNIDGVVFENINVLGKKLDYYSDNFILGNYVRNIIVK